MITETSFKQKPTSFSVVLAAFQAPEFSVKGSANRDSWELPGLVSALRGRNDVNEDWFFDSTPDADEGREFVPHELAVGSRTLSLPAVEGRVPLPPDDGRPLRWLGELPPPSAFGDREEEPHALDVEDDDLLPQLSVPLIKDQTSIHNIKLQERRHQKKS